MRIVYLFLLTQLFSTSLFAQIQGDVLDQNDKGIANAIITATESLKNIADTVKSDSRGFYSFSRLKPGNYKIQVKAPGFKPFLQNIVIKEGETGIVTEGDLYSGQRLDINLIPLKEP